MVIRKPNTRPSKNPLDPNAFILGGSCSTFPRTSQRKPTTAETSHESQSPRCISAGGVTLTFVIFLSFRGQLNRDDHSSLHRRFLSNCDLFVIIIVSIKCCSSAYRSPHPTGGRPNEHTLSNAIAEPHGDPPVTFFKEPRCSPPSCCSLCNVPKRRHQEHLFPSAVIYVHCKSLSTSASFVICNFIVEVD